MTGRVERERARQVQDRCQRLLSELLRDDDNKYCVDCDAKGPRWASWNLGIFLCIRCAGIHRNLGVHISKVKSVNLDSWTPEQVVSLQQMGNSRARAVYEANLPDAFRRPQTDSSLEAFIRAKYEHRKYVAREWVPPSPPQVNWDKEIDEEMEKQKKKKKSSSTTSTISSGNSTSSSEKKSNKTSNVVPKLLPKPKSSVSPKPGRATPKRDTGATADLLGTGNATVAAIEPPAQNNFTDDVFSSFLSAPHDSAAPDTNKNAVETTKAVDLKSEEESFFNQPAPSEKEKSKMTKDSILALYGQPPPKTAPVGQFVPFNSALGFPQQPNPSFGQGFSAFQPQMPPALQTQNFATGFNQLNSLPTQTTFNNQFQTGQFASLQNFAVNPNQNTAQYQGTNLNGMFPQPNQPVNGSSLFAQSNLSQQFGGMSLGQSGQPSSTFPAQQGTMTGAFPSAAQPNLAANGAWP